ncbi:MAG: hypothetical protein RSG79_19850 [Pseudomonas sp.]
MKNWFANFLAKSKWGIFVALILAFITGVVLFYLSAFGMQRSADQAVWGQFGDYFGGILNPILSFCAFVGLMLTLKFQYSESQKAEQRQMDQKFDSRLFQLFGLISTSLSSVHLDIAKDGAVESYVGPKALTAGLRDLVSRIMGLDSNVSDEEFYTAAEEVFSKWEGECGNALLSYFDTLLFASMYIMENSEGDRQVFAARAVRSQLSKDARVLLFYSCILSGGFGFYKFFNEFDYWRDDISERTAPHGMRLFRRFMEIQFLAAEKAERGTLNEGE